MRAALYWGKAVAHRTHPEEDLDLEHTVWAGSDVSQEEADRAAALLAEEIERTPIAGGSFQRGQTDYPLYPTGARPEPMTDSIEDERGRRLGAVTITNYGADVLNTASLAFIDVDLPPERSAGGLLASIFGKRRKGPGVAEQRIEGLRAWVRASSNRGARVYRTAAGLRYLIVSPEMDPESAETAELMRTLRADDQYALLCRVQGCFRARLTPKPWRVGIERGRVRFEAYAGGDAEIYDWLERYHEACDGYAACAFLEEIGSTAPPTASAADLIDLHDRLTGAHTGMPLA